MNKLLIAITLVMIASMQSASSQTPRINFQAPKVYPEGVAYDPGEKSFFVSSVKTGTIGKVSEKGEYKPWFSDSSLKSSFGMKVDPKANLLWVCTGDPNYSQYSTPATFKKQIRLVAIDIASGEKKKDIDLSSLFEGKHFANDLAFDKDGNIYITDSFSPVVYKVDKKGQATVFAESEFFKSIDIGLNGIAYHPKGFLVVINNSEGQLYKIDLKNPKQINRIKQPAFFIGGDGLLFDKQGNLILVQNKGMNKVYQLSSADNWASVTQKAATSWADRFKQPSTLTLQDDKVYVLNSKLDELSNPTQPPSKEFSLQLAVFK